MSGNLISVTKKLSKQLEVLEQELSESMRRVRRMESRTLVKIGRARKNLDCLPSSKDWMDQLLHIIDVLGEAEKFLNEIQNIGASNERKVEEVSLESLMECDARVPF